MSEQARHIHLYFPENDIALAHNIPNFTPPKPALQMRLCGQALPMWYGNDGDAFVDWGINAEWYDEISEAFRLKVDTLPAHPEEYVPMPWGWSPASRRVFEDIGICHAALPSDDAIDAVRRLSSRRTSSLLGETLSQSLSFAVTEVPKVFDTIECLSRYIADKSSECIVKMPWSNAGRGNIDCSTTPAAEVLRRAADAIKRYGFVTAEVKHERIADFAMLWTAHDDGSVSYDGLSLFETSSSGAYVANILLPDKDIRNYLERYVAAEHIDAIIATMDGALESVIGGQYRGRLGVDMLVAQKDGGYIIDPFVEVNMRCTMGHVAHSLAARHLAEGCRGRLYISTEEDGKRCLAPKDCAIDSDGRMRLGRINMTPPAAGRFSYIFEVSPKSSL